MLKTRRNRAILFLILVQTIVSILAGLTLFFLYSYNRIPKGVYVDKVYLGGLDKAEAVKKVDDSLGDIIRNNSMEIRYDKRVVKIKYSDIDASLDSRATVDEAYGHGSGQILYNFVRGYFSLNKHTISPVVSFNEGKLREKLNVFNNIVNRGCKNASITVDGSRVIKVPEVIGCKFNMDKAIEKICKDLGLKLNTPIIFTPGSNSAIETNSPELTLKDFKGVDDIIAQYATDITDMGNSDSIKQASSAINNTIIYSEGAVKDQKSGFSFNKCLKTAKIISNQNDEGYNQVASTLYAAVLIAGVDQNTITRSPHEETVDYIKPGLDTCVSANSEDLKFSNTLGNTIVITAEVKENKVIVSILGKKLNKLKNDIETEVEQRYAPTVINMENQDLKPGQKKMISPGKEGLKVNVYKVSVSGNREVSKKLLYYDSYKPVEAVIQIGPNTNWYDQNISK